MKKVIVEESSEDDDDGKSEELDEVALLVRKTTKMLQKLDKKGIDFNHKSKKFSIKKKSIKDMDCYNCGELGHLAHQCPLPDKRKKKN
ncbi:hypothetical protein KFY46_26460, partial [Salmonella enterica subsp. enterica serovar 1,4,[5],12:i:-]|nr:hypothetical protein [Salmonella enterica subsp. enterica serovar 1,4,[5],12:i:-]